MTKTSVRKKRPEQTGLLTQKTAEAQIAKAAGTEFFAHRDPLYHVTENFQQTFDKIGQKHAADMEGVSETSYINSILQSENNSARKDDSSESSYTNPQGSFFGASEKNRHHVSEEGWIGKTLPGSDTPLSKFSQTAFQRGNMSAAVLQGTGKMMLVSSLKRTIGQSEPKRMQQHDLLDTGARRRNVPLHTPDQMIYNKTFAESAIGIVVDTLRDARRTVQSMTDMVQGIGETTGELKSGRESNTLKMMYPFLDDSEEKNLIPQYEARLKMCTDENEKAVLQNALVRTRLLVAKKAQMKYEFINKLRFLSDRATEALDEFESPGFLDDVLSAIFDTDEAAEGSEPGADRPTDDDMIFTSDHDDLNPSWEDEYEAGDFEEYTDETGSFTREPTEDQ